MVENRLDDGGERAEAGGITGRHVLIGVLIGFGIILSANMALVIAATGSFPGLVVKNSYVASQDFNHRQAERAALGWRAEVGYAQGVLSVALRTREGEAVLAESVTALVGRPSDARSDRQIALARDAATGRYTAPLTLDAGQWRVLATATAPGQAPFSAEARIVAP